MSLRRVSKVRILAQIYNDLDNRWNLTPGTCIHTFRALVSGMGQVT